MYIAIIIFIIGTILGSFYLVIATRLPKEEDVIFSRSHCDACHQTLKWYNLIPILSYIIQKGKCSYCHQPISFDNLVVELATGILFLFTYLYLPFGYELFGGLIVSSLMIIIFISDFKYMIILDSPLIITSILIIILKYYYFGLSNVLSSIASGIVLFFMMLFVAKFGGFMLKKESLGGGDIKLAFVIGLILGLRLGLIALILSTFLALPYALTTLYLAKNHEFPYGPFLVGALFIVFFTAEKFLNLFHFLFI